MRTSRFCLLAAALAALASTSVSNAETFEVVVTTPIAVFDGTGTGSVPLASDPNNLLGNSINGYGYVNATATLGQSSSLPSSGTTTITVDFGLLSGLSVAVSSVFNLNLDLLLTDNDTGPGRDFATGSPLALTPKAPLVITAQGNLTITDPASILTLLQAVTDPLGAFLDLVPLTTSVNIVDARYALGADINGNGVNDILTLRTADLDPELLSFDVADADMDAIVDGIVNALLNSSSLAIGATVNVSGIALTFEGEVSDAITDPPFTLEFEILNLASILQNGQVPEPSSFWLLLAAALSLLAVTPRRRGLRAR